VSFLVHHFSQEINIMELSINTSTVAHANHLEWATGEDYKTHEITAQFEYSASKFHNGKRTNKMAIGASAIILDIDDGVSLKKGIELFSSCKSLIVTTKSHQVDKKGLVADRYRVILFLDRCIIDMLYYTSLMKIIIRHFGADVACSDSARYYSPNPNQLVYYSESKEIFNLSEFEEKLNDNENVAPDTDRKQPRKRVSQNYVHSALTNRIDLNLLLNEKITYYHLGMKITDTLENLIKNTDISDEAIKCHCFLNPKHEDNNPSAYIYHNQENIYSKCVSCGVDGLLQYGINYATTFNKK